MGWSDEQKRRWTGPAYDSAPNVAIGARRIDEARSAWRTGQSCASVPAVQRYDPATQDGRALHGV